MSWRLAAPERRDPHATIAWARERIAGFKVPKSVDVVAALPRDPPSKILRRETKARAKPPLTLRAADAMAAVAAIARRGC